MINNELKKTVTQEFEYGCAIACIAFLLNLSYREAEALVGEEQAGSNRFWVKDVNELLNSQGLRYARKHIKTASRDHLMKEGTIALIRRSKLHPSGHYLIRHNDYWMDPWINLSKDKNINNAVSGYRKRLPGSVMYIIYPSD